MTLIKNNSSEETLVCQWTGEILNRQEEEALALRRELVRQQLVAEFSSSPLYQARAAKDPEYWNKFSTGRVR